MDKTLNGFLSVNRENPKKTTVRGRELHAKLEIKSKYTTWMKRMIAYGFDHGKDFFPIVEKITRGRPRHDHELTIEMAKSICMFQRTPAGIACGEYLNQIQQKGNN